MTNGLASARLHRGDHIPCASQAMQCDLANAKVHVMIPLLVKAVGIQKAVLRLYYIFESCTFESCTHIAYKNVFQLHPKLFHSYHISSMSIYNRIRGIINRAFLSHIKV